MRRLAINISKRRNHHTTLSPEHCKAACCPLHFIGFLITQSSGGDSSLTPVRRTLICAISPMPTLTIANKCLSKPSVYHQTVRTCVNWHCRISQSLRLPCLPSLPEAPANWPSATHNQEAFVNVGVWMIKCLARNNICINHCYWWNGDPSGTGSNLTFTYFMWLAPH